MKQLSYNKNLKRLLVCLFVMLVSCSALFGRNPIKDSRCDTEFLRIVESIKPGASRDFVKKRLGEPYKHLLRLQIVVYMNRCLISSM